MSKKRTTITVDEVLLERARSLGLNVSAAAERALAELVEREELNAEADRQLTEFEAGDTYDERLLDRERRRIDEWEARIAARDARGKAREARQQPCQLNASASSSSTRVASTGLPGSRQSACGDR